MTAVPIDAAVPAPDGSDSRTELAAHYAPIFDDDVELAEAWLAYRLDGDDDARRGLILTYTPVVRYVVSRMNVSLPPSMERADLVGFGVIGLMDAIGRFDLDRGLTFPTYAVTRIRGAILDELRSLDWVPRGVRTRMHAIERAISVLEQENGAEPTIEEVAEATGLDIDEVRGALQAYSNGYVSSLDERMSGDSEQGEDSAGRQFCDQTQDLPDEIYDHEESQRLLRRQIHDLKLRDRAVIALYYFEELNFAEIGRALGISESRACQLHGRALRTLHAVR